jgi:glycosyltransferase involved in cell wall biosynthesis
MFIIVGGDDRGDEKGFRNYLNINHIRNVQVTGYIKSEEVVGSYLSAADVLVLPNSAHDDVSLKYTSPLKLFAYMAARRPIVASDLPSLREVLNENNSVLIKPDSATDLADGIKTVVSDSSLASRISHQALEDVRKYSWKDRAETIISFIKNG